MSFLTGRGFVDVKILQKKKNETGPISLTMQNVLMKFCIHIDIDKI